MSVTTATRRVTVASPAANVARRFNTSAGTWGQLKPEISAQGINLNGVEAIMNPGNVTLTRDDAELASGDFKIYLVPTKNKAGISTADAQQLGEALTSAIIKAAESSTQAKIEELRDELIEKIEEFFDVDLDLDTNQWPSTEDPDIAAARKYL